jgi:O-antigen/teichoic acid export membrane protein
LMWVGGLNLLVASFDTMLLGVFRPVEEVGIYGVAARTVALVGFVLIAVNNIAGPKFAELFRKGDMAGLTQAAVSAIRINILVTIPLFITLFFFPEWVLKLFGKDFQAGAYVLTILAVGQLVNVLTGPVGQLLIMSGNERSLRTAWIWSAGVNFSLNIILIPHYGVIGAAIANCIGISMGNALSMVFVRTKVGLKLGLMAFGFSRRF